MHHFYSENFHSSLQHSSLHASFVGFSLHVFSHSSPNAGVAGKTLHSEVRTPRFLHHDSLLLVFHGLPIKPSRQCFILSHSDIYRKADRQPACLQKQPNFFREINVTLTANPAQELPFPICYPSHYALEINSYLADALPFLFLSIKQFNVPFPLSLPRRSSRILRS